MSVEVMKQALEALMANHQWHMDYNGISYPGNRLESDNKQTINDLRRAIEQAGSHEPCGTVKQKRGYPEGHCFVLWTKDIKPGDSLYLQPTAPAQPADPDAERFCWMQSKISEFRTRDFGKQVTLMFSDETTLAAHQQCDLRGIVDKARGVKGANHEPN